MAENNMPGSFGTNQGRAVIDDPSTSRHKKAGGKSSNGSNIGNAISSISPERWVDIVCLSIICFFLLFVAITWESFSAALFYNLLFPLIVVGAKLVAGVAAIGALCLVVASRFRRRRWWW